MANPLKTAKAGRCSTCGNKPTRRRDPRQAGHKGGWLGDWFNYRCSCGFALDAVEYGTPEAYLTENGAEQGGER